MLFLFKLFLLRYVSAGGGRHWQLMSHLRILDSSSGNKLELNLMGGS